MRVVYIEPYEAGSHARFSRTLRARVPAEWTALTLPGRHWKWRMRGSAAYFALARADAFTPPPDLLFASSYLPLTDLIALCPALAGVPRVLYFHENQLAYPTRGAPAERDNHFGFTQLVSAMAATRCVFNSGWNRDSFLSAGADLLARLPDAVPSGWIDAIAARSVVLPVPLDLPGLFPDGMDGMDGMPDDTDGTDGTPDGIRDGMSDGIPDGIGDDTRGPVILWNHRWEHDKDPDAFFAALYALADRGVPFRLAVCGERFRKAPPVFAEARARLADRVVHWGYLPSRAAYHRLLGRCHLAVSTARHEFFGISMLEATWFGVRPVVPDRLSYPEIFPSGYRYPEGGLLDALSHLCAGDPTRHRSDRRALVRPYGPDLIDRYRSLLAELVGA